VISPWTSLLLAGAFEICWAVGLKYSDGFSRPVPTTLTMLAMAISIWFLAIAVRQLDLGTAYAIWTGIGAIGTVIAGIILFSEPVNAVRFACIGLILLGIIGLKLTTNA
jgi:quaternary ammonium compound-resistance protein SugE